MRAKYVEDMQLFQRASLLAAAILAITRRMHNHHGLRSQLNDSATSIAANIAEGFSQPTDRAFARYLAIAAGSAEEVRVHLRTAELQGIVTHEPAAELMKEAREIANMLRGFIRYLHRCDRRDRLTRLD
jgi:four helix bundle protein